MISTSSLAVYREWEEEDEEDFSLSLSLSIFLDLFPSFLAGIFCFLSCRRLRSDHHSPITFVHTGFIPSFFLSVAARPGVIEKRCGWQSAERRRKRRKKRRETLSKRRKRAGCADACKDRDEQDAFGSCR